MRGEEVEGGSSEQPELAGHSPLEAARPLGRHKGHTRRGPWCGCAPGKDCVALGLEVVR